MLKKTYVRDGPQDGDRDESYVTMLTRVTSWEIAMRSTHTIGSTAMIPSSGVVPNRVTPNA